MAWSPLFPGLLLVGMLTINPVGVADAAQQPPPIHGVTGTIATDTTIQETSEGAHRIFTKAADGFRSLFRMNRRRAAPSDAAAAEVLRALTKGAAVGVHYPADGENLTAEEIERLGDSGLKQMEGVVTDVNLADQTISIRLADGTRPTFRLSDRAGAGFDDDIARAGGSARVIVYFKDEGGRRVAHYFTRVS